MRLPYQSIDDFMNSQIQTVTFPSANLETSTQQRGQYEVTYPGGKELEPLISKDLSITFKLLPLTTTDPTSAPLFLLFSS